MIVAKIHRIYELLRLMKRLWEFSNGFKNLKRDYESMKLGSGKEIDIAFRTVNMVSNTWTTIVKEFNIELVRIYATKTAVSYMPAIVKFMSYASIALQVIIVLMIAKKMYDNTDRDTIDNLIKTLVTMKESVGKYYPSLNEKVKEIFSDVGKKISESAGVAFTSIVGTAKSASIVAKGGLFIWLKNSTIDHRHHMGKHGIRQSIFLYPTKNLLI